MIEPTDTPRDRDDESLEPVLGESEIPQDGEKPEGDADEIVHELPQQPTDDNIKADADDAVHKGYKPPVDSEHENDERDPDDLVHGNV